MVESVYSNRVIAPDSETRMWKDSIRFAFGEFVESHHLGGGVYPTLANVNHSCDPNFNIINLLGNVAVAIANRTIEEGEELHDTYGALFYHMEKSERLHYLKVSTCFASINSAWVGLRFDPKFLKFWELAVSLVIPKK